MYAKFFGILVAVIGLLSWTTPAKADTGNEWKAVCSECHEPGDLSEQKVVDVTKKILAISAGTLKHKKAIKLSKDKATAEKEAADMAAILVSFP